VFCVIYCMHVVTTEYTVHYFSFTFLIQHYCQLSLSSVLFVCVGLPLTTTASKFYLYCLLSVLLIFIFSILVCISFYNLHFTESRLIFLKSVLNTCHFVIFQCSFIPRFSISIDTRYEDNKGTSENVSFYSFWCVIFRLLSLF